MAGLHLNADFQRLLVGQTPGEGSPVRSTAFEGSAVLPAESTSGSQGGSTVATSGASRPRMGKGSRGPRPRLFKKGECQADGCSAALSGLPRYNLRNHICLAHKAADSFFKQGAEVRFCQRCGVAHPLSEFDGLKKSCRRMLALHNSRRRKSGAPSAAPNAAEAAAVAAANVQLAEEAQLAQQPQQVAQSAEQLQQGVAVPAAVQLLPALAGMQLGPGGGDLLLGAELEVPAGPAPAWAGAGPEPSPSVSVGSAGPPDRSGCWPLTDGSGGGGGGLPDGVALPEPLPPYWQEDRQLRSGQLAAGGVGAGSPLGATAAAAPEHERVCCSSACGAWATCCGGRLAHAAIDSEPASGGAGMGARAMVGGIAARAGVADGGKRGSVVVPAAFRHGAGALAGASAAASPPGGDVRRLGAGALLASGPAAASCSSPCAVTDAADTADSRSAGAGVSDRAVEAPPDAAGRNAASAAALSQLQQHNAALYQLFVQQQLMEAQKLLVIAGGVLSQRLPMMHPSSSSSVSVR